METQSTSNSPIPCDGQEGSDTGVFKTPGQCLSLRGNAGVVLAKQTTVDEGELLSAAQQQEKTKNHKMFIIMVLRLLAPQGLALRGNGDETSSNFYQLLVLLGVDHTCVETWRKKSTNKYTSIVIQNDCLQLMAHSVLRDIGGDTLASEQPFFTIMVGKCMDCSKRGTVYGVYSLDGQYHHLL